MVQIIKGTFGWYNGRKVVPITREDGPQHFDPELEARLVAQGVAEYASVPTDLPEYNEGMRLEELQRAAAAYGVDASGMRRKSDVIRAIEAAQAGEQEQEDEPPLLVPADPV